MITNSFIFLERISQKAEQIIWNNGVRSWEDFLNCSKIKGISKYRKLYYDRRIIEARKALFDSNSAYFSKFLPQSETWRLYDFFKEDAVFLDIETNGLGNNNDITVFGLYDGLETKIMIDRINFNPELLKKELEKYKLIVTFNGASFDVPFIRKRYPELLPEIPNFDVMHVARRLGLSGGLKNIERTLGFQRTRLVEEFNGGDALTLWRMYRATGDEHYLNLLIEYNEYDIINLKKVAEHCVRKMRERFGHH